ncbi:hypothetical protein GMRT_10911 [Giardia muris]|uniref:Uncharacterized protein n=1 Tax=Giardia muris TaxID=5742 RepID=A0A4Z1T477_GIAMU|nr:hypothetical protein GMRT_10911 [Giardia muris]|eukprot:TNJ30468.1 hypothetical protein GMRT_10911 [Giardia muris]
MSNLWLTQLISDYLIKTIFHVAAIIDGNQTSLYASPLGLLFYIPKPRNRQLYSQLWKVIRGGDELSFCLAVTGPQGTLLIRFLVRLTDEHAPRRPSGEQDDILQATTSHCVLLFFKTCIKKIEIIMMSLHEMCLVFVERRIWGSLGTKTIIEPLITRLPRRIPITKSSASMASRQPNTQDFLPFIHSLPILDPRGSLNCIITWKTRR